MKHHASTRFWACYEKLPSAIQRVADEKYQLLAEDPYHPSLHFKKVGKFWSVRVGIHYRALGVVADDHVVWFWIGSHADYDKLLP